MSFRFRLRRSVSGLGWGGPLAALALMIFTLCGCGRPPAPIELTPLEPGAVVLSYIAGINPVRELYQERGLGSVLQEVLNRRVVHAGIQEEFARDALARLPGVLAKVKPSLVILGYGMTDIRRQQDADALKADLKSMIELAQQQNIEVVMVAMPQAGFSMKPHKLYEELSRETGVPAEMEIVFELMRTHSLKGEKWTLNDAGIRRLSEALRDLLVQHGAL